MHSPPTPDPTPQAKNRLKISEAAARLSCHPNTVKNMMRDGRVQAVNLNPGGKRPTWRIVAAKRSTDYGACFCAPYLVNKKNTLRRFFFEVEKSPFKMKPS
jgi:hypothetical protein